MRDSADARRRQELRRWIVVSAAAHALALVALLWVPAPEPAALPGVVTVDLVALAAAPAAAARPAARAAAAPAAVPKPVPPAPQPAPPKPAPAPVAAPPEPPRPPPPKPEPPKPPPPKPAEAVIPKRPEREPEKPKARPDPKPDPPPEPPKQVAKTPPAPKPPPPAAQAAPPKPPAPKPAPPAQESYDDLLADLRAERGESRPERVERPARIASAGAATGSAAGGAGGRAGALADPEFAGWVRAVAVHLSRAWILPPEMRGRRLMTELLVDLDAQGNLLSDPRIVRGSGDARFDENALRAIRKASPLPPPPAAGVQAVQFCPEC